MDINTLIEHIGSIIRIKNVTPENNRLKITSEDDFFTGAQLQSLIEIRNKNMCLALSVQCVDGEVVAYMRTL